MRTIGFRSNVLFIVAASVGLLASLGRPWYAPAAALTKEEVRIGDVNGPVETFFLRLAREFTSETGTTGWVAFSTTDTILCVLIAFAVISAFGSLRPGLEQLSREVLRLATFGMLGIVVVKLANTPDAAGLVERRQGAWIALGVSGIMASSAATLYTAPFARRKSAPSLYENPIVAPPRSHVFDSRHGHGHGHAHGHGHGHARGEPGRAVLAPLSSARPRRRGAGPGSQAGSR